MIPSFCVPVPARPTQLGPYEVVAKIAGGGMAAIYLGRARVKGAEPVVAIKVIRHDLSAREDVVAMFLDEAGILVRLSHPNVARTYEYGIEGQQHFIAMELLLGRTLMDVWEAAVARGEGIPYEMAAWIAARIADGLHHAHELKGEHGEPLHLIHRDVNPSNVFLTYDGSVKLFDFGLAKALGRRAQSAAGIVKGKLPYLSPEQIMQFPIDRRCDVFTLGTTLWELATMRRLFKREDDVDTVKAVRGGPIPDPRTFDPAFPEPLAKVIRRALERNREHRFATAADLARDLDAFVPAASAATMPGVVSQMLDHYFPGERKRQSGWLKQTRSLPAGVPRVTMAPPGPISTASMQDTTDDPPKR